MVRSKPLSLVCKVTSVDGRPAVKLSDNPMKALGRPEEVERYLGVFGAAGRVAQPGFSLDRFENDVTHTQVGLWHHALGARWQASP